METAAYVLLWLSSFTMAFSLPTGRSFLALSLAAAVVTLMRERRRPVVSRSSWFGLAFLLLTSVITVFGVNPGLGGPKLIKLVWFFGIPLAALLLNSPARLAGAMGAYAAGAGVLSLRVLFSNPFRAAQAVSAGTFTDFSQALIDAGSMTDGQRLMVGIIICIGMLLAAGRQARGRVGWVLLLALLFAAMVVNMKRGSWICTLGMVGLFLVMRANWRWLLAGTVAVLALGLVPSVRLRVSDLATELTDAKGGRMLMWRVIGPELVRQHPLGVGYRSLTNEMMREIDARVESDRDHLHSNFLQVLVESGWAGLVLWLLWMGSGLAAAFRYLRGCAGGLAAEQPVALAVTLALTALLANGIVEYNMGDSEVVLAYTLLLGAAVAGRRRVTA